MSDDVSLAGIPGELTASARNDTSPIMTPAGHQAATRLWEASFAVCLLTVLGLTLMTHRTDAMGDRWIAAGLLVAMGAWYVGFGRRLLDPDAALWRGLLFHAVMLAAFGLALSTNSFASFLLFALCPIVYMTLPVRVGHGVVALYAFAPAILTLAFGDAQTLGAALSVGAVVFVLSVVIAVTTARTERTSAERARLIDALNQSRAEVARLSREAGIAHERQRLAGDIHDTVAQGLSSVAMLVEAADAELDADPAKARAHLALAARTARENLDEARAIVAALTPSPLAQATLADALARLAARHQTPDTAVEFIREGHPRPLPTGAEVVLLRVAQESLTNTHKHAAATHVTVRLDYQPSAVVLQVEDDGRGFKVGALRHGYGLDAMRARVEQVGGRLTIASDEGKGTTVRTEIDA